MRIVEIIVTAARTISNPNDKYGNSKPELKLRATIEGDDINNIDAIAMGLQDKAEALINKVAEKWIAEATTNKPTEPVQGHQPEPNTDTPPSGGSGNGDKTNGNTKPASQAQIKTINDAVNRKKLSVQDRKAWVEKHIFNPCNVTAVNDLSMKDAMDLLSKLLPKKK